MKSCYFSIAICLTSALCFSQSQPPHPNAHSHNDYENVRPLLDALHNGFVSVEADVHLQGGELLVSHNSPGKNVLSLEKLYLFPLDSILNVNAGRVYPISDQPFFLMIDIKTEGEATYRAIQQAIARYPALRCLGNNCQIKVFLSGNRPAMTETETYTGIGTDGRPDDLGKGHSPELMPVISDHFKNWSAWNGKSKPSPKDLQRVRGLAERVHAEKKLLRLWAIPDNELAWAALLDAGVDLINTDHLQELNYFLNQKGL
jgi:hypothetical protein